MRLTPSREESSCSEGISWPGFIITVKRRLRAMSFYQYLLSMVLAIYVGFSRLHHLRYVARDPMLTRILKVLTLPVQSTYWRFLDCLHGSVAQQLLQVQQKMRERVWAAAQRSEEHTSELQSLTNLVCRLLLEKKKKKSKKQR